MICYSKQICISTVFIEIPLELGGKTEKKAFLRSPCAHFDMAQRKLCSSVPEPVVSDSRTTAAEGSPPSMP